MAAEQTYYTLLGVGERALAAEIKAAYRKLIKQVHPDVVAHLPPRARERAEGKAKEVTEAYAVLGDAEKRRRYDELLAGYRRQPKPAAAGSARRPAQSARAAAPRPVKMTWRGLLGMARRDFARWRERRVQRFKVWRREHPALVVGLVAQVLVVMVAVSSGWRDSEARHGAAAETIPQGVVTVAAETGAPRVAAPVTPGMLRDGLYVGTVRLHGSKEAQVMKILVILDPDNSVHGCSEIGLQTFDVPPLEGTNAGKDIHFWVSNAGFHGKVVSGGIAGTYGLQRLSGEERGDFRLTRRSAEEARRYQCSGGALVEPAGVGM